MPSHGELVLGVDGGGTKTVAWLARRATAGASADANAVIGRGKAGPGNPRAAGFETAQQNVLAAINAAFADASVERGPVAAACLALAGAGRSEEQARVRQWALDQRIAANVVVTHDAAPVLAVGSPDLWGIALIAGTGSLAWGRGRSGQTARCGGWGYLLGDEGSGYAIGVAALRAGLQAADGRGPATLLLAPLLDHFQVRDVDALVGAVYGDSQFRARIAAASPLVFQLAEQFDEVARGIIDTAIHDLASMVSALARRLEMTPGEYPFALAGGLFDAAPQLCDAVAARLVELGLAPGPRRVVREPVEGAVRLAEIG